MSFNILAERLAPLHPVDEAILDFKVRAPRIVEEIKQNQADIICLQECDNWESYYKPEFDKMGYQSAF